MKHRLLLTIGALLLWIAPTPARAVDPTVINTGQPVVGYTSTMVSAQTINATASYTSDLLDTSNGGYFGAWYKCTSASSAPEITITWDSSPTIVAADVVATTATVVTGLVAETVQYASFAPPPAQYGRIKVTGAGANPADTVCNVKVFLQGVR